MANVRHVSENHDIINFSWYNIFVANWPIEVPHFYEIGVNLDAVVIPLYELQTPR